MFNKVLAIVALAGVTHAASAQDSTSTPLTISGSVDAYYKYDLAKTANIGTSFATDHNSVSLGMIDVALKKTTGKASFVGEVSFGPRGQYQSIPTGDSTDASNSFHIQNLYATYAFTDKFSMTAGYMGTFIGYEVISPVGNFNYSTSYLFTNGPFQNAGIKANYALSSKIGLMAGLFNDKWNTYTASPLKGVNAFGAQLSLAPIEGWNAYLNVLTGSECGTIFDVTTAYQVTDKFKLGLNAADFEGPEDGGYTGVALYPQVYLTSGFALGLRGEYFKWKDVGAVEMPSYKALTVSANLKSGGLTFIPEFRFDNASVDSFKDKVTSPTLDTKSASQFSFAVVYAF